MHKFSLALGAIIAITANTKLDELNSGRYSRDQDKDGMFREIYYILKQFGEYLQQLVEEIMLVLYLKANVVSVTNSYWHFQSSLPN